MDLPFLFYLIKALSINVFLPSDQITGILNWMVRALAELDNNILSVERVRDYSRTPKEVSVGRKYG